MNGFQFMFTYESLKMFTTVLLLTADCHLWVTLFCLFFKELHRRNQLHQDPSKTKALQTIIEMKVRP